jgi:hypothetical protein
VEIGPRRSERWQLDRDLPLLETQLRQFRQDHHEIRLLVIDPVRCFLGGGTRRTFDLEQAVSELADLAQRWNLAVVVVSVEASSANRRLKPVTTALAETARSIWTVVRDLEDPDRRLLLPVKSPLSARPTGWAFSIQEGVLEWEPERVKRSAADFAAQVQERKRGRTSKSADDREWAWALAWLAQQLAAGSVPVDTLRKDARDCNVTAPLLRRAFFALDCEAVRETNADPWHWFSRAPHDGFSCASRDGLHGESGSRVERDFDEGLEFGHARRGRDVQGEHGVHGHRNAYSGVHDIQYGDVEDAERGHEDHRAQSVRRPGRVETAGADERGRANAPTVSALTADAPDRRTAVPDSDAVRPQCDGVPESKIETGKPREPTEEPVPERSGVLTNPRKTQHEHRRRR